MQQIGQLQVQNTYYTTVEVGLLDKKVQRFYFFVAFSNKFVSVHIFLLLQTGRNSFFHSFSLWIHSLPLHRAKSVDHQYIITLYVDSIHHHVSQISDTFPRDRNVHVAMTLTAMLKCKDKNYTRNQADRNITHLLLSYLN